MNACRSMCLPAALSAMILSIGLGCAHSQVCPCSKSTYLNEQEAVALALDRAKAEGVDTSLYSWKTGLSEGMWWVYFDRKEPLPVLGHPNHFGVSVAPSGETEFFGGR